jgi:3-hydroxyisobutyrate dehydrogenase
MNASSKIGIVGTGRMGSNIARRLKDVGYTIAALYDIHFEAAQATARDTGGEPTRSLARVTECSDIVITVVTDDTAMEAIFARDGDSLLESANGRIFINCATLSPRVHVDIQDRARVAGAQTLEACMASSITQARNGTLYLMIGGDREVFAQVEPLLRTMSASLRYVGEMGRASQVKALVNMVMNINTAGLAEGLGLADSLGLDLNLVRDIFSQTGANSRVLETDGADMQNRDHEVYFSAEHAAKDSGIALVLARQCGVYLPLAQATYAQYERMKRMGLGNLDKSGISELTFRARRGRELPDATPYITRLSEVSCDNEYDDSAG